MAGETTLIRTTFAFLGASLLATLIIRRS